MGQRYIELDDISHLNKQAKGGGVFEHRLWRESYYFNMTDKVSGISFITTIGILPNRRLLTGFFLIIKDGRIIKLKPFIQRKRAVFNDYIFNVKGLRYFIEGTNWRLSYDSKQIKFDILFTPMNNIFSYVTDGSDIMQESVGSQHYEQFGRFEGELIIKGKRMRIGPCFGHRDHSWGIRDWSSVDFYRYITCAFSEEFAFNLWEGSIYRNRFVKGYVFDGADNTALVDCNIESEYLSNSREPVGASVKVTDERGREFEIDCNSLVTVPAPPRQSVVYECVSKMQKDGMTGYGVQEYLYHEPNPFYRFYILLKVLKMM
jgi:hypothetical protein